MNINSSTKLICLLGQPVNQSFSPSIHNYLSEKYNKSQAQIILRWHLQNDVIAIPKTSALSRIKENLDIFDFEISTEDMEKIDSINTGERMKPQEYENLYKVI